MINGEEINLPCTAAILADLVLDSLAHALVDDLTLRHGVGGTLLLHDGGALVLVAGGALLVELSGAFLLVDHLRVHLNKINKTKRKS